MLDERSRLIQRVCFDIEPSEADLETLGSPERWLVYRDLVRTRLVGVVDAALPRSKAAIGEPRFASTVAAWLSTGGSKTRYFRHVPNELVDFALPLWTDDVAPWVLDLARYEIASWSVRHAASNLTPAGEFTFDTRPLVGSAVRVLRLEYPVHEGPTPEDGYGPSPHTLCLYRNDKHRAVPKILNPLAADLLEAWQRGDQTVAESVQQAANSHGVDIGPAFVEKLSTLIADFITDGILLGRRA